MLQMFDVDWTDPLLYDLVINTETIGVMTAVGQVLELVAAEEFQPTPASRQLLADRALAARVRATLKATQVDLDIQATGATCSWRAWSDRRPSARRRSPSLARHRA